MPEVLAGPEDKARPSARPLFLGISKASKPSCFLNLCPLPAAVRSEVITILGRQTLSTEERCAKVPSGRIPLNAVPAKAESQGFLCYVEGESHSACSGTAPALLSELPRHHQDPQSSRICALSSGEGPEQGVRAACCHRAR